MFVDDEAEEAGPVEEIEWWYDIYDRWKWERNWNARIWFAGWMLRQGLTDGQGRG